MRYTKESILKNADVNELFALFHTFKEYYNECADSEISIAFCESFVTRFEPTDAQLYRVIEKLKETYGD